ncbi:hypothetical protein ACFLTQ_03360 [Chloroflexota bacterium]
MRNPIDAYLMLQEPAIFEQALAIVAADPLIDIILADLDLYTLQEVNPTAIAEMEKIMTSFAGQRSGKLLVALLGTLRGNSKVNAERTRLRKEFSQAGIGIYRTLPRACRALAKFIAYHEFQLDSN